MAKAKKTTTAKPPSRGSKWPASVALVPWLECYLGSCERTREACPDVRLRQLAECGHEAQALKRLERFLAAVPSSDLHSFVMLSLVGAEIRLDLGDNLGVDKHLAAIEARLPKAPASKRKFLARKLDEFRVLNGLANDELADEEQVKLGKQRLKFRQALAGKDAAGALAALQKVGKLIPELDDFLTEPRLVMNAIKGYRRLGKEAELAKYVMWLDRNNHTQSLNTGSLYGIGLTDLARKRAEDLIGQRLKHLKTSEDVNIHFPVDDICKQLAFLIQTGDKVLAGKLLKRTLKELPSWPGLRGGFAGSGALTGLAEILAEIDGPEAAKELLHHAEAAGSVERSKAFRKGALDAAKKASEAPGLAAAIEKAKTIGNAKKRRDEMVSLYAKQANWPMVASILDQSPNAAETHALIYTVLFRMPGGDRLM